MLVILHEIMSRIKNDKKLSVIPKPCEYFHLIGGTSTGGCRDPQPGLSDVQDVNIW